MYFASIEDLRALQEYDLHVHRLLILLPTHAFLKHFKNSLLYKVYILPLNYTLLNNIFLVLFMNNLLIYSCDVLCKGRDPFPKCSHKFLLNGS